MTHNPYRPPGAPVEAVSGGSAKRGAGAFLIRFYASPFGRTGRLFYWLLGVLPLTIIAAANGFLVARVPAWLPYATLVLFALFWPQAVLFARRLHDMNLSGWWAALFWLVPIAFGFMKGPSLLTVVFGLLAVVTLGFIPGTRGSNRYGADPRGGGGASGSATSSGPVVEIYAPLLDALNRQLHGDETAAFDIRAIAKRVCGVRVHRDPSLSPQQVRVVEMLLNEWQGMYSFVPGRPEGLPHVISLLKWTGQHADVDIRDLGAQDDWKKIVAMRGPVETVLIQSCSQCKKSYPGMGTSGFLELIDLLCDRCGAVTFRSTFEGVSATACPCGGTARIGCPACGATESHVIDEQSPYRYFATHSYYWNEKS